jgi:hypothetical protein
VDITPIDGIVSPDLASVGGYGDADWSEDTYGTPRSSVNRMNPSPPVFTLDNWGEELRVMTSPDGRLLRWSPTTPNDPLVPVTNAPTGNRCFVVTPERHVMLFGVDGDVGRYEWCDEEDDTNWTPSTTSKAGGYNIEPYSPIVSAKSTPYGVVIFTNRGGYVSQYIGLPYIYSNAAQFSDCPPPYSPASLVNTPQRAGLGVC